MFMRTSGQVPESPAPLVAHGIIVPGRWRSPDTFPVWFTVMFAVCLQTSFLTPPVGGALFYLRGIAPPGVDLPVIYRGVAPFIIIQLVGLVVIFQWEALATWLPAQAYGIR